MLQFILDETSTHITNTSCG